MRWNRKRTRELAVWMVSEKDMEEFLKQIFIRVDGYPGEEYSKDLFNKIEEEIEKALKHSQQSKSAVYRNTVEKELRTRMHFYYMHILYYSQPNLLVNIDSMRRNLKRVKELNENIDN
jgi:hypothetical protein